MLIKSLPDRGPQMAADAYLSETAAIIGEVSLGSGASVWYGAVLRGDVGKVIVGEGSNIQDNCVLHTLVGQDTVLGRNVSVGHGAVLHSCTVEDDCLIGMGSVLLDGCVIGKGSVVAAGAVVSPGTIVPAGSMVMGLPGKVRREVTPDELAYNLANAAMYREGAAAQLTPAGSVEDDSWLV